MKESRKQLLLELEDVVGSECYNGNIQNWGPNGIFLGEGRSFRYPVCFDGADGSLMKKRSVDTTLPSSVAITGHYRFGANELQIVRALDKVLSRLEGQFGLRV